MFNRYWKGALRRWRGLSRNQKWGLIAGVAIVVWVLVPLVTYAYFAKDLTSKERIMNRKDTGVTLLDRNNKEFFHFYEARSKSLVTLEQIPDHLEKAVVASEDKDFYKHQGYSIKAILSALYADTLAGKFKYGGSTITQQLVKNALLSNRKSLLRKYQEVVLALEIDRRYSKDEILEMYLNSIYLGEGAFGVDQAATAYFGKPVGELTLAEAALIVGILPAPSMLSPITGDAAEAKKNQGIVLDQMAEAGFITTEEAKTAKALELAYQPAGNGQAESAHHFALMVRDKLIEDYGEEKVARSGMRVKTTLDVDWQYAAEQAVAEQMGILEGRNATNAAVVVADPKTGEIRALVGSRDYSYPEYGAVNMATTPRQPGSSIKPIWYATAIDKKVLTAGTVLHDKPTTYPDGYKPNNFDFKFHGDVLPRRALANSMNIPAVEMMNMLGVDEALDSAENFGYSTFKSPQDYGLSLALGAAEVSLVEHVNAYGALANGGVNHQPAIISAIDSKYGQRLFTHRPDAHRVMDAAAPFIISNILADNSARREVFGSLLTISRPAAVKTGSTEDYRDALTVGYTPSLVVGVWVGNNDNTPTQAVAGSAGAVPIWRNLMEEYLPNFAPENFTEPPSVTKKLICQNGGLAQSRSSNTYDEYFIRGTEPKTNCNPPAPERKEEKKDEKKREEENNRGRDNDNEEEASITPPPPPPPEPPPAPPPEPPPAEEPPPAG